MAHQGAWAVVFGCLLALCGLCSGQFQGGSNITCTITFGISLSLQAPATDPDVLMRAQQTYAGLQYWLQWSNSTGEFAYTLMGNCSFALRVYEDYGNVSVALNNYRAMMNDSSIGYLLGPPGDAFALPVASLAERAGRLLLGTGVAADNFYVNKTHVWPMMSPASASFTGSLRLLSFRGVKRIAFVSDASLSSVACTSTLAYAWDLRLTVVAAGYVPTLAAGAEVTDAYRQNVTAALSSVRAADPDVLLLCGDGTMHVVDLLKELNWMPRALLVYPLTDAWASYPNRLYVGGVKMWMPTVTYRADPFYGSTANFSATFQQRMGLVPNEFAAVGAYAPLILQAAVQFGLNYNQLFVEFWLGRTSIATSYARISYDGNHAMQAEPLTVQFQSLADAYPAILSPSATQDADLIYPAPGWDQRAYTSTWLDNPAEVVIIVATTLVIATLFAWLVFVIAFYNQPVIRSSSPLFCCMVILGGIILCCTNYAWQLHETNAACQVVPWLLGLGFTLMFGSLFVKTWRVFRIFLNPSLAKLAITNTQLLLRVAAIVGVEVLILIVWMAAHTPSAELKVPDVYRPALDYEQCRADETDIVFIGILAAYKGLILLFGIYLAYRVRNVDYVLFNESRFIAFAMYNLMIFTTLVFILQVSNAGSPKFLFVFRSVGILLGVGISIYTLFVPKVYYLRAGAQMTEGSTQPSGKRTWGGGYPTTDSRSKKGSTVQTSSRSSPEEPSTPTGADESLRQELKAAREEIALLQTILKKTTTDPAPPPPV